jgi:hypothetical protein
MSEETWAQLAVELAVDRYGGENGSETLAHYGLGPDANGCRSCGVAWVGTGPCWLRSHLELNQEPGS